MSPALDARVVGLWRYPVKSLQGERLEATAVDERGFAGDRAWGIVDLRTGVVLTARREPRLLFAAARVLDGDDGVEIELPDGRVTNDDAELSGWLGRPVELRRARPGERGTYETPVEFEREAASPWVSWQGPEGTFHDSTRTRVSIVSEGAIGEWDVRRFRPNVLLSGDGEDALVGRTIRVGTVLLDVGKQVDRCVVATRPQPGGLERDLDVLRTINAERATFLGVGALVAGAGRIAVGDVLVPA